MFDSAEFPYACISNTTKMKQSACSVFRRPDWIFSSTLLIRHSKSKGLSRKDKTFLNYRLFALRLKFLLL